jgi:hypothetical protein
MTVMTERLKMMNSMAMMKMRKAVRKHLIMKKVESKNLFS